MIENILVYGFPIVGVFLLPSWIVLRDLRKRRKPRGDVWVVSEPIGVIDALGCDGNGNLVVEGHLDDPMVLRLLGETDGINGLSIAYNPERGITEAGLIRKKDW